jgi:hypothetical protein
MERSTIEDLSLLSIRSVSSAVGRTLTLNTPLFSSCSKMCGSSVRPTTAMILTRTFHYRPRAHLASNHTSSMTLRSGRDGLLFTRGRSTFPIVRFQCCMDRDSGSDARIWSRGSSRSSSYSLTIVSPRSWRLFESPLVCLS